MDTKLDHRQTTAAAAVTQEPEGRQTAIAKFVARRRAQRGRGVSSLVPFRLRTKHACLFDAEGKAYQHNVSGRALVVLTKKGAAHFDSPDWESTGWKDEAQLALYILTGRALDLGGSFPATGKPFRMGRLLSHVSSFSATETESSIDWFLSVNFWAFVDEAFRMGYLAFYTPPARTTE